MEESKAGGTLANGSGSGGGGGGSGAGVGSSGSGGGSSTAVVSKHAQSRCWKEVICKGATMPYRRSGAASVVVGDKMYVFGGYGGDGRLDDFWEYTFEGRSWRQIEYNSSSPGVRENNGVVEHDGKLYLFGGYNGSEWLNDFWEFDLESRIWRQLEPRGDPPASRFGYVSMTWRDVFLLFGGYDGATWLNDMHEFSFETELWRALDQKGNIPSIRSCPSWAQRGDSVFMFGGYDGVQRMNDFFEFRLDTYTWTLIPSVGTPPSPRYFHSCAFYGNCMYTFGGYNGSERLNDMHEFNFDTHRWSVVFEPSDARGVPSGRSSLIAQVYGHSLYLFGGYNGHVVLNDFYEYRFEPVSIPPSTLLDDLRMLINNRELSDVTFVIEGKKVYASRVHLAARSEHFRAMLFGGMRESESGSEIVLSDVSYPVFMKMLEFLYTDVVSDIAPDLKVPLLIASERYLLDRLKGLCEDSIRKSITSNNVVHIFMAAHRHRAADLKEICLEYIVDFLDEVKCSRGFLELTQEPDLLLEIIMRQPGGGLLAAAAGVGGLAGMGGGLGAREESRGDPGTSTGGGAYGDSGEEDSDGDFGSASGAGSAGHGRS